MYLPEALYGTHSYQAAYSTVLPETVQETPVCQRDEQVSPSMPTQAEPTVSVRELLEGMSGTTIVPVTEV